MIAVVDYGAGNLRSVSNALVELGCLPRVTREPKEVLRATAVIFPGVGAAADAMESLRKAGMDEAIKQVIGGGQPVFAICVGMQLLLSETEEGGRNECLKVISGAVRRLPSGLKVPQIGWNQVKQVKKHPIFKGIPDGSNFYFVHSYYAEPEDKAVVAGTTEYGVNLCSMLIKDNLIATQFHPEKSGELGLRMYANFLEMAGIKE
jgi:glutamine amidotransferase